MKSMERFFDDFTLQARVMPAITITIPLIIYSLYKGIANNNILEIPIYSTISLVITVLLSKLAREKGKNYEERMYRVLGGKPTTIIMRYTDKTIDNVTKTRYHKILGEKIGSNFPLSRDEENAKSDELYSSGMTYLRNYANANRSTEERVYQELKEYNYWRNLYGCKLISIVIYMIIAIREIVIIQDLSIKELIYNPYPKYAMLLIMVISIIIMLITVNKQIVKRKAFDYAKALAESCERVTDTIKKF